MSTTTKKLSLEFSDTGEFTAVQRAVAQMQEKYRKRRKISLLWRKCIYWLGLTRAESREKYKMNVELSQDELPQEEKLFCVIAMSVRSGKDPKPEKVSDLLQQLEMQQLAKQRNTDALPLVF